MPNRQVKPEVMLVEDDYDDRYLIRTVLGEVCGYANLVEFENGDRAIKELEQRIALKQRLPSIVLLDLNMPVFDGFEFLSTARSSSQLAALPIIVYTTSSAEADIVKSYQLGANAYMVKPLSYTEIRNMFLATCQYWLHAASTIQMALELKEK